MNIDDLIKKPKSDNGGEVLTVDYANPLSKGEMALYGLAPANIVQQPIQIAV